MATSNQALATFLSSTEYFNSCSFEECSTLAAYFDVLEVPADGIVLQEGETADGWFLVIEGEVDVIKGSVGHPDHCLAHLTQGEGFGEMALIDDSPRMATVVASGATTVGRLPREAFNTLLDANHPGAAKLLRAMAGVLCHRQRELTLILQDLVDDPGPRRRQHDPAVMDALLRAALTLN